MPDGSAAAHAAVRHPGRVMPPLRPGSPLLPVCAHADVIAFDGSIG
ncbi:hypothetical protein ACWGH3_02720 [Streptomyces sp. NPDC054884]|nr:hypothetical protein [Streptomyces sp. ME08-AFT2]MDX3310576.1 hypothetical protein [Streptomyces sp. ME08-AFT2]